MSEMGELDADGDVTMLGGQAGRALPFDPRASPGLARQETCAIPMRAVLPFADGRGALPEPPPQEPMRVTERPAWMGMHPDPSRARPPAPVMPARPVAELERAALEGAAAASTAALARQPERPNPSRVRLLVDVDTPAGLELVDVLYAPTAVTAELRRASTGCCGDPHASTSTGANRDPRAVAHHAMSHATARTAEDLSTELTRAFRRGSSPPAVAVTGMLSLSLDELASFKATAALATAFLRSDPQHAELLAQAGRVDEVASDLPEDTLVFMRGRLEEALRRVTKNAQLEVSRDRSLIERRRFASCEVLGGGRLRGSIRSGAGRDIVCYLPPGAAAYLPFSRSFQAIVLATVHAAPDANAHICLDVLSLGRPAAEGNATEAVSRSRRGAPEDEKEPRAQRLAPPIG